MLNPFTAWTPGLLVRYHGSLATLHGVYEAHPCTCLRCDDPDLGIKEARTVAGSLRKNAAKAGVTGQAGISYAKRLPARTCTRYTSREVALICLQYKPRKPAYKAAAAKLALAA